MVELKYTSGEIVNVGIYGGTAETFIKMIHFVFAFSIAGAYTILSAPMWGKKNDSDFRKFGFRGYKSCLLYTSPSPRDKRQSRMPSSA